MCRSLQTGKLDFHYRQERHLSAILVSLIL
jgi:hypothetical protein